MILEKLTVDEDSLIFFACSALSFFAISLFSMIVSLSAIRFERAITIFSIYMLIIYKHVKVYRIFPFVEIM